MKIYIYIIKVNLAPRRKPYILLYLFLLGEIIYYGFNVEAQYIGEV